MNKGLIALSGSQPPRNKECSNLLKSVKRISNDTLLTGRIISGYQIEKKIRLIGYPDNPTLSRTETEKESFTALPFDF